MYKHVRVSRTEGVQYIHAECTYTSEIWLHKL